MVQHNREILITITQPFCSNAKLIENSMVEMASDDTLHGGENVIVKWMHRRAEQ